MNIKELKKKNCLLPQALVWMEYKKCRFLREKQRRVCVLLLELRFAANIEAHACPVGSELLEAAGDTYNKQYWISEAKRRCSFSSFSKIQTWELSKCTLYSANVLDFSEFSQPPLYNIFTLCVIVIFFYSEKFSSITSSNLFLHSLYSFGDLFSYLLD